MFKTKVWYILTIIIALIQAPSMAQAAENSKPANKTTQKAETKVKFEIGFANNSCSEIISALSKKPEVVGPLLFTYVSGFLSGSNMMQLALNDSFKELSDIEKDMSKYIGLIIDTCRANPETKLRAVLINIYNDLPSLVVPKKTAK